MTVRIRFAGASVLALTLAATMGGTLTAHASKRKPAKPRPAQEVYSTVEPDDVPQSRSMAGRAAVEQIVVTAPTPIGAPSSSAPRGQAPAPARPAGRHGASDATFDPVPSDQVDALSQRLKLVEALIRRHGRAYDYRVHTVRQLEALLTRLDGAAQPTTPANHEDAAALPTAPTLAPTSSVTASPIAAPTPKTSSMDAPQALPPVPSELDEAGAASPSALPSSEI